MALQATKTTGKKWDMVVYRFSTSEDTQSFINYIETTNKDPLNSKRENIPCEQIDNYRVKAPRGIEQQIDNHRVKAPREIEQFWLSATGNFDTTNKGIEWHRLTKFRHIAEVYENNRLLFDTWKRKGLIPGWALNKMINNVKSI